MMNGMLANTYIYKGDRKMSDKELELVMEYEKEVQKVVRKYTSYFDQDDLYQVGMIGLMKAVQHVDYDKLEQFRFYARYYIQGEINQFLRENNMIKQSKEQIALRRRKLNSANGKMPYS